MNHRKLLNVIVAGMLGAAALFAAGGVLLGRSDLIGRAVGTLVVTTIGAAILAVIGRRLNWKRDQPTIVAVFIAVAIEFVIVGICIWGEFGYEIQGRLIGGAASVGITSIAACVCIHIVRRPVGRIAGPVGMLCAAAALACWLTAICSRGHVEDDWIYRANTIFGIGVFLTMSLLARADDRRWWRWLGVVCAIAGLALALLVINQDDPKAEPLAALLGIAVAISVANALAMAPIPSQYRWISATTVLSLATTLLIANIGIATTPGHILHNRGLPDPYERVVGAGSLLFAGGLLAIFAITRMEKRGPESEEPLSLTIGEIIVQCPICRTPSTAAEGVATCNKCGLMVHVRAEEPRCVACGYSLLMNPTDRCPECGVSSENALVPSPSILGES